MLSCDTSRWGRPVSAISMRLIAALLTTASVVVGSATAYAAEPVEIPDGNTVLKGVLYRPEGAGPFRSVVALHGCGGLLNKSGKIVRRFADWGDRLAAAGLAVLFADSFASRGLIQSMPRPRTAGALVARAGGRRQCGAALAAGAGLVDQEPGLADGLVEWRHGDAVGRAPARRAARWRPRLPLRGRLLSRLPAARRRRLDALASRH